MHVCYKGIPYNSSSNLTVHCMFKNFYMTFECLFYPKWKLSVPYIFFFSGSHYIHLFWSDIPLTNSPFHGFAIQQVADASKLILTGRGLKEAVVREEAEFVIDGSQAGRGRGSYA